MSHHEIQRFSLSISMANQFKLAVVKKLIKFLAIVKTHRTNLGG